jgi:signal transduction histidine kinase
MVTISDAKGAVTFSRMPAYIDNDFEDEEELQQLKERASELPFVEGLQTVLLLSGEEDNDPYQKFEYQMRLLALKKNWTSVLPIIDNDLVEVYVRKLSTGEWIKVGRSSEEREELLASTRYIALIVFIPFLFIGIALSMMLAKSILRPIRNLDETVRRLKNGDLTIRGKLRGVGDEIDVLTEEFNALLDKNDSLIRNLKSTVDNVAHDLRTPLTRLRSSAEYALTNGKDVQQLKESLSDALESSEEILDMMTAIMDVAEAETQTMTLKIRNIQVSSLIARLINFFQEVSEDKKIRFRSSISESMVLAGDEVRLLQAFSNLIDNAIKYSPPGTEISIGAEKNGDELTITFSDQGIGIEESELEKIWERLYRADRSRSTPGMGIGLSLVKAIVTVHGGSVRVDSRTGEGSTFYVTLPICNESERRV